MLNRDSGGCGGGDLDVNVKEIEAGNVRGFKYPRMLLTVKSFCETSVLLLVNLFAK